VLAVSVGVRTICLTTNGDDMKEWLLVFETSIPDDTEKDDRDEIVTAGGEAVLEQLRQELEAKGFHTTQPRNYNSFAWEMDVRCENNACRIVVQTFQPWLLIAIGLGIFRSPKRKSQSLIQLSKDLRKIMSTSDKFTILSHGERSDLIQKGYKIKVQ